MTASRRDDEMPRRPLMDPEQTSVFLGVPVKTLKNWRSLGEGPPYVKVGRYPKYDPRALDRWIEKQTRGAA